MAEAASASTSSQPQPTIVKEGILYKRGNFEKFTDIPEFNR